MTRRIACAHEHRVGRQRPHHGPAPAQTLGDGGGDHLDLLAAKQPPFARVRVQASHSDARRAPQAARQRFVRDLQGLQQVALRHGGQRVAQGHMDADQHGAQLIAGQHHAHGHVGQRNACVRSRLGLQQLGVAGVVHTRRVQGFLVQRCRHQPGHLATQGRARGPHHALRCRPAGLRRDLAPGHRPRQAGQRQHRQATRRHVQRLHGRIDLRHRQLGLARPDDALRSAAQRSQVAHGETAAQQLRCVPECLGDDLGAYACRVSLGDGQRTQRRFFSHLCLWRSYSLRKQLSFL